MPVAEIPKTLDLLKPSGYNITDVPPCIGLQKVYDDSILEQAGLITPTANKVSFTTTEASVDTSSFQASPSVATDVSKKEDMPHSGGEMVSKVAIYVVALFILAFCD